jgi:hypothetical protein
MTIYSNFLAVVSYILPSVKIEGCTGLDGPS